MPFELGAGDKKNLKKRYLIWFYKTLKEEVDKIARKFTQIEIDEFVLKQIRKESKKFKQNIKKEIKDFERYIQNKKDTQDAVPLHLSLKLQAVEKAIVKELGKSSLAEIKGLYEEEMARRILESREH